MLMQIMTIKVPDDLHEAIKDHAHEQGKKEKRRISQAEVVRKAVYKYLRSIKKTKD
jgi:Arc/MetJ-type ribon-helix-helix transcriptional regulator